MAFSSELLARLALAIRKCERCPLAQGRTQAVPGEGAPDARVMFIGEGPGAQEDESGRPFVGAAGQLLDKLLARAGLRREEVFITNVVKCRPPGNRTPTTEEIAACNDWLIAQIAAIQPEIIVCIGSPAAKTLLSPDFRITRQHGVPLEKEGITYLPVFHPAAILRETVPMEALEGDFEALRRLLSGEPAPRPKSEVAPPPPEATEPAREEEPGQLGLF